MWKELKPLNQIFVRLFTAQLHGAFTLLTIFGLLKQNGGLATAGLVGTMLTLYSLTTETKPEKDSEKH